MRASVVICTLDRADSVRQVLDALRRQTHADFEVVVVAGPSGDGTAALLAARAADVRVRHNPLRNLSVSRNLGIAAAAGEAVAFLDDDAIPEPRWLEELLVPLAADPACGAAGGTVLDHTGTRVQWRYLVCGRDGEHDFDRRPPLDAFRGPGADPFVYVPGGNSAFRRAALADVGGFDAGIEYNFDETEVCLRLHDRGWGVAYADGARVHHRALPSHLRSGGVVTDPFTEVKNRVAFGVAHGGAGRARGAALASANRRLGALRATARDQHRHGRLDDAGLARYLGRADAGFHAGLARALRGARESATVPAADPSAFRPYPRLAPARRRRLATVGEPGPAERALAAAGHEPHAIVPVGPHDPYRVLEDGGVWRHEVPVGRRWLPELDADRATGARAAAERAAAVRGVWRAIAALGPVEGEPPPLPPGLPAAARDRLEDPARFPVDWEQRVRTVLDAPDHAAFVAAAYRELLGREPDPLGARRMRYALATGTERAVLRAVLGGVEARGAGVTGDPAALLPALGADEAAAGLRRAWTLDDSGFAAAVVALLVGDGPPADDGPRPAGGLPDGVALDGSVEAARDAGAGPGTDRRAWVAGLLARPDVRARVGGVGRLPPADVRTADELARDLRALLAGSDARFVDRAFRRLTGVVPEPHTVREHVGALRGGASRAHVLRGLAATDAAGRWGTDAALVRRRTTGPPFRAQAALNRLRALRRR